MKTTTITWNPITYEPGNIYLPILAITKNDKLIVFKDTKTFLNGNPISGFSRLVKKYNIKWWVYQNYITNNNLADYYDYED